MNGAWKFLALTACLGTFSLAARPSTKHIGKPRAKPAITGDTAQAASGPVSDSAKAAAALAAAVRRANDSAVAAQKAAHADSLKHEADGRS
ncbi:MAG TPA: hypothetical protein VJ385_04905, partial [Fibrobacteria bacterium]|nr:hypothetical protein [Fibrobacteria bacterium]